MYYNELNNIKNNSEHIAVDVIILTYKSKLNLLNRKIYGKQFISFIQDSLQDYNYKTIEIENNSNIIELIKQNTELVKTENLNEAPLSSHSKYTLVLYFDTPFLTSKTITEIIDFATLKELDICTLPRGYVFKNKFLIEKYENPTTQNYMFNDSEFFSVQNFISLNQFKNSLQEQILLNHLNNNVNILDLKSCNIDFNVKIENNVTIHPHCTITNNSVIKTDTIIFPNSFIENSIINKNCKIYSSVVVNSTIPENSILKPFSYILNNKPNQ